MHPCRQTWRTNGRGRRLGDPIGFHRFPRGTNPRVDLSQIIFSSGLVCHCSAAGKAITHEHILQVSSERSPQSTRLCCCISLDVLLTGAADSGLSARARWQFFARHHRCRTRCSGCSLHRLQQTMDSTAATLMATLLRIEQF